ncbi:hypothetical protein [Rhodovibrio sodomensis]|nr:hypothetical protein [Rhodovibrio sodomensis]
MDIARRGAKPLAGRGGVAGDRYVPDVTNASVMRLWWDEGDHPILQGNGRMCLYVAERVGDLLSESGFYTALVDDHGLWFSFKDNPTVSDVKLAEACDAALRQVEREYGLAESRRGERLTRVLGRQ